MSKDASAAMQQTHSPVALLDIQCENAPLLAELQQAVAAVIASGRFVFGPDCAALEEEFAKLCGTRHAIACASGSDALLLALMAHDIGPGDEVIVPSFTFFATASAPWRLGAKPVFVDIDRETFNLDPQAVAGAVTTRTKAIIPVHLFGQCAAMDQLNAIAARHHVAVIEDACQAVAAQYGGRTAGSLGHVGCFSFYPTKNLGGFGDGGMLTTSDDRLAATLRKLRNHGMEPRYYHQLVGVNSRLDTIQAAALRVKLPHLGRWTEARRANAARYGELFAARGLQQSLGLPHQTERCRHVWNQYTIRVPHGQRDALRKRLSEQQIGSEIYYPVPLHQQECFARLRYADGSLPETERAASEVLSLPIYPNLTAAAQARVVDAIAEFLNSKARAAA
jgi:dTDP-4-amino-4,6-dideoxygalactose transaminase